MREFVYYSRTAPTSGKGVSDDLMRSGRLDIAIHTVISSLFLSHKLRENAKLHLVFAGPPDPVKHLEFKPVTKGVTGVDKIYLNKSDVSKVVKKLLYKYRPGERREVFPGFWVEKKPLLKLVDELISEGKEVFLLDPKGDDIRGVEIPSDCVFVLGDHLGLPNKDLKRLRKVCSPVSIGGEMYFASHTVAIVNNELDRRKI